MRTAGIKEKDIVQVDIRGERFFGIVDANNLKTAGTILVTRIGRRHLRSVTLRQIIGHYRKSKDSA